MFFANRKATKRAQRQSLGFSLIELMICVAILSILAAMIAPTIRNFRVKAKQAEAFQNLNIIHSLAEAYAIENGNYGVNVTLTADDDLGTCDQIDYCNRTNLLGFSLLNCQERAYDYTYSVVPAPFLARARERYEYAGDKCTDKRLVYTGCSVALYDHWTINGEKQVLRVGTNPASMCY